jgi:pre-mRNA-splicing factor CWC26
MSAKADYLKKYGDKKKKKEKSSKDKKSSKDNKQGGLTIVDDDGGWATNSSAQTGHTDEVEDESPVLVQSSSSFSKKKGSWEEEAAESEISSTAATAANKAGTRHDSDSDGDEDVPRRPQSAPKATTRHDSDSDEDVPRRPLKNVKAAAIAGTRHDSDNDDSDEDVQRRLPPPPAPASSSASTHRPNTGLIASSGGKFAAVEEVARKKRQSELAGIDATAMGKGSETIYRDSASGKKVDSVGDYLRKEALEKGIAIRLEKAQKEMNRGSVQQRDQQALLAEMEKVAQEGFARGVDNHQAEAERKQEERDGDPMAEYFAKKRKKEKKQDKSSSAASNSNGNSSSSSSASRSSKPSYTGPSPAPNRFNIAPGFRWDAVDRGNGYEKKVMLAVNKRAADGDSRYSASVAQL